MRINRRTYRRTLGGIAALLFGGILAFAIAPASQAAEVDAITNVGSDPDSVFVGQAISVTVDFVVPGSAVAGDTISIQLSSNVTGQVAAFPVSDQFGVKIADCVVESAVVTCTFTDYVEEHPEVSGSFNFPVIGDDPTQGSGLDFTSGAGTNFHTLTEILPAPGGLPSDLYKSSRANPDGSIHYYFGQPGAVLHQNGPSATDAYDSRLVLDRSSIEVIQRAFDPSGAIVPTVIDPSRYSVAFDDANNSFTVTFDLGVIVNDNLHAYWVEYNMIPKASVTEPTTLLNTVTEGSLVVPYELPYTPAGGGGTGLLGEATWSKVDQSGAALAGAEFLLVGPNGVEMTIADNGPWDSDPADGEFRIIDLIRGDYSLTETMAPAGYILDPSSFSGTITQGATSVSFGEIVNQRASVPEPGLTVNTGGQVVATDVPSPFWMVMGLLSLAGIAFALRLKRHQS